MEPKILPDGYVLVVPAEYGVMYSKYCEDDDHPRLPPMQKCSSKDDARLLAIGGTNFILGADAGKIGLNAFWKSPFINDFSWLEDVIALAAEGSPPMQKCSSKDDARLLAIGGTNFILGADAGKIGLNAFWKPPFFNDFSWLEDVIAPLAAEGSPPMQKCSSKDGTNSILGANALNNDFDAFLKSRGYNGFCGLEDVIARCPAKDKGKRLAISTGYGFNSSCGETSTKHHDPSVPEVCIDILDGNDKIDPAKGNHGCTDLIHHLQWIEHKNQLKNSKLDDDALKMMIGIFTAVTGQVVGGVMVHRLTSSGSSSWAGPIVEIATVLGLSLTLAGISLRRRSRALSTLMIKVGAVTTALAIIFSMGMHLPPTMAFTVGLVAFLIMSAAAAFA